MGIALSGRIANGATLSVVEPGAGAGGVQTLSAGTFAAAAPRGAPNTLPTRGIGIGSRVVLDGRGRGVEDGGAADGGTACGAGAGCG